MKKLILSVTALTVAAVLTGCRSDDGKITATSQPTSTATASPSVTAVLPADGADGLMDGEGAQNATDGVLPGTTVLPETAGVTSMDKAKRVIEQIEDELERLSEVEDAEVVLAGNKAAVALAFDDQYKGGLDDRLRGIVKERIAGIVSGVSTVAITADKDVMDTIGSLGERLDTFADMSALQSDLDAIIRKINGISA